jgi:asparagine synthase (glutamine-hydrolysing)
VRDLLTEAVHGEMVSDVPLGLFFSGGIDSTILAALMARHSSTRVKTFTVVFRDAGNYRHDDLRYARLASQEIGTEHHELDVSLSSPEAFLDMVGLVDQPSANPTLYIQYLIAQATRREVTVALSGVGGDELFGGYPKYWLLPAAPLLSAIPAGLGGAARNVLGLIREDAWSPWLRRAKRLLRGVGYGLAEQYVRWGYALTEEEKRLLFSGERAGGFLPAERIAREILEKAPRGLDRYEKIFAAELETFLADNLLEYTDRATMAVALETRVPFLNHRLVELAARIPFHDKIRHGRTKVILVDAFKDMLPKSIVDAPKRGFSPPIGRWMGEVLDLYFERTLTRAVVEKEGIFRWDYLDALRTKHRKGLQDCSLELVSVLMFDVWYRRYILKQPA